MSKYRLILAIMVLLYCPIILVGQSPTIIQKYRKPVEVINEKSVSTFYQKNSDGSVQFNGMPKNIPILFEPVLIKNISGDPFWAMGVHFISDGSDFPIEKVYYRYSEDGANWSIWSETELFDLEQKVKGVTKTDLFFIPQNNFWIQLKLVSNSTNWRLDSIKSFCIAPGRTPKEKLDEYNNTVNHKHHFKQGDEEGKYFPRPSYISRSNWGSSLGLSNTNYNRVATTVTHLVLHNSAGQTYTNDYAAVVRSYYLYHVNGNGWSDIGYNWLVDPNGVIYQGRAWKNTYTENVIGAHNSGYNSHTLGLCMIGNYEVYQPNTVSLDRMANLMAFLCDKFGLDPLATTYFSTMGEYKPVITGHKHSGGGTSCPGVNLISRYSWFRNTVHQLLNEEEEEAIVLVSPLNGSRFLEIPVVFNWKTYPGANSYRIQLSENGSFNQIILDQTVETTTFVAGTTQIEYGKTYYWRIKANNSNWSNYCVFSTNNINVYWEKSARKNNLPEWFGHNSERGIAYSGNSLFVVSNSAPVVIRELSIYSGAVISELSTENIQGGYFEVNDIESSWDGQLLACNLTLHAHQQPFKIYRWQNKDSSPELFIQYSGEDYRLGDTFTVFGNLSNNAVIFAAVPYSDKVLRWVVSNGLLVSAEPEVITLSGGNSGSNPSVAPFSTTNNTDFFINSIGRHVQHYDYRGTLKATLSGEIVARESSVIKSFAREGQRFLLVFQTNNVADNSNGQNIRVVDVTNGLGNVGPEDVYAISPRLGNNSNSNGTGDIAIRVNSYGDYMFYVLSTNNGIAALNCQKYPLRHYSPLDIAENERKAYTVDAFNLLQNFPNPFNPVTRIPFEIYKAGNVKLLIYNVAGQKIRTVLDSFVKAGTYSVEWDGKNDRGDAVPSGSYIYQLVFKDKSGETITQSKKMIFLK